MYSGTVAITAESFEAVGAGTTGEAGSVTLMTIGLTFNERAARFTATLVSENGELGAVQGVGLMVPEQGWTLNAVGTGGATLTVDGRAVTLSVSGEAGVRWIGHLEIVFTQDYSAE